MSIIRLKTAATVEPLSVADMKTQCNISHAGDDALLAAYIAAARQDGEALTNAAFVESTWEQVMEGFPAVTQSNPRAGISLLKHPVPAAANVVSVSYLDTSGVRQTLTVTTHYQVVLEGGPLLATVYPAYGFSWPDTYDDPQAVVIEFKAGWPVVGEETSTPENIKSWLKLRAAGLYEKREDVEFGSGSLLVAPMPRSFADRLLDRWTMVRNI